MWRCWLTDGKYGRAREHAHSHVRSRYTLLRTQQKLRPMIRNPPFPVRRRHNTISRLSHQYESGCNSGVEWISAQSSSGAFFSTDFRFLFSFSRWWIIRSYSSSCAKASFIGTSVYRNIGVFRIIFSLRATLPFLFFRNSERVSSFNDAHFHRSCRLGCESTFWRFSTR